MWVFFFPRVLATCSPAGNGKREGIKMIDLLNMLQTSILLAFPEAEKRHSVSFFLRFKFPVKWIKQNGLFLGLPLQGERL